MRGLFLFCLSFCVSFPLMGQGRGGRTLRVMEWNVENLFDTVHDVGFHDEEFLPQGERRWNSARYLRKLKDISRTIAATATDDGVPHLVALCEVENDSVLVHLTRRSTLRNLGYDFVSTASRDARGIDVALLYQPAQFALFTQRNIIVPNGTNGLNPTRDILYVAGRIITGSGIDTLHVFVVHMPSRRGGTKGDRHRMIAARTLWNAVDSVLNVNAKARIVAMGDFNATSRDAIFKKRSLRFTDDKRAHVGTYYYRNVWQWLDHIMISETVSYRSPAKPVTLPWLMEKNVNQLGKHPRRTFLGPSYHGGISDHLPIILDIDLSR